MKKRGLSLREFAKQDGCTHTLVRRGIVNGHLKPFEDGSLDPALVGSDWRQENRRKGGARVETRVETPPQGVSTTSSGGAGDDESAEQAAERILAASGAPHSRAEAERIKENYLALLRQQEYEQKAGKLVELEVATTVLFEEARAKRDSWLNWPARIGPLLATDLGVEADKVTEALTAHVHKHIAQLGGPDADFASRKS